LTVFSYSGRIGRKVEGRGGRYLGRLEGKVALISGAARGLGAAEAALFCAEGASVVLGDILDEPGAATTKRICDRGGRARFVHLDVTREAGWTAAVDFAEREFGKLNVLVNNAGVAQRPGGIEDTAPEEWERVLSVNLTGTYLGTRAAIPALRRAGGGSIVNTSSVAGLVASKAVAYGAAKGGVRLFTKSIAIQHARDRIRCNSIHPGSMDTEIVRQSIPDPAALAERVRSIPLGRLAEPEEVALAVLYLASDEAAYVTGSELVIDGGLSAM
jgi:NAD(P)-dependent dehydrogenase (short-subunit alcohol dehydrogenase family)